MILCRLPSGSVQLRKLVARLRRFEKPVFYISNCPSYSLPLGETKDYEIAFDKVDKGERFTVPVKWPANSQARIFIYLRYWEDMDKRVLISGFPRVINLDKSLAHWETSSMRLWSTMNTSSRKLNRYR